MSPVLRLASFAAILTALFGGGTALGAAIDPDARSETTTSAADGGNPADGHDAMAGHEAMADDEDAGMGASTEHGASEEPEAHGLAIADAGLQIELEDGELHRGRQQQLRFAIVTAEGAVVRDFDVMHERRMHFILARRDLSGFQHLHPVQRDDGTWTVPVKIDAPGSYRAYADFTHDGEAITLATDLRVDGRANLRPLPPPATTAVSDGGYDVRLQASNVKAGEESERRFSITRNGMPVHTEPYLGAGGHLVALREGDMAFLHVHPTEHANGGSHDDAVGFAATFPTPGRYRLFLQFKHTGRVQTVAFTQAVS